MDTQQLKRLTEVAQSRGWSLHPVSNASNLLIHCKSETFDETFNIHDTFDEKYKTSCLDLIDLQSYEGFDPIITLRELRMACFSNEGSSQVFTRDLEFLSTLAATRGTAVSKILG